MAAQGRSSLLLCHRALGNAFKEAVQRSVSATLTSVTLDCAPPYTVHGYARVHTSIYIYIYMKIPARRFGALEPLDLPAPKNTAKHCKYRIRATWALETAARARSVPQERSNGLLEPPLGAPRALKGPARTPARCPKALEVAAPAPARCPRGAPSGCSSPCSVPQERSKCHFEPLLGATSLLLCHWALEKAFEKAVRRICALLHPAVCHFTLLHSTPCMDMHGFTLVYIYIYISE
jgi:hypothetical protein